MNFKVTAAALVGLAVLGPFGAAPALAAVPGTKVSAKEKVALMAWVDKNQGVFEDLGNAFQKAGTAANSGKASTLHTDCVDLESVIRKVQAAKPIPVQAIETVFKESLSNLMTGTLDCVSGTQGGHVNNGLLKKTGTYWKKGGNQLITVGKDLDKALGS